jgi:ADP-ribosylglycohydrolase
MTTEGHAAVWAAFAADSLALGAHWIYDQGRIEQAFGRLDRLRAPLPGSYHPTRAAGDFTHYGDQTLVLLESLAETGGFDAGDFSARWQRLFRDYTGYRDQATKATLANLEAGRPFMDAGSGSDDLAGAARIAPLLVRYAGDEEALAASALEQTLLTHRDPLVVEAAGFFARTGRRVMMGESPAAVMTAVRDEYFRGQRLGDLVQAGLDSAGDETKGVLARFGLSCHGGSALPGTVHLIARYEKNLVEGLVQNTMSGGDSAARGLLAGMILGASAGMSALPEAWLGALNRKAEIGALLDRLG